VGHRVRITIRHYVPHPRLIFECIITVNNSALHASNLAFECNIQGQNRDCQFGTSCLISRNRIHRKSQNKHFPGVLLIGDRPHMLTMIMNVTWRRLKMQKSDAFLNIYSAHQPAINTGHIFFFIQMLAQTRRRRRPRNSLIY
jgi:hypothetical protein